MNARQKLESASQARHKAQRAAPLCLLLAFTSLACVTRETFYLEVLGSVTDAATAAPLADVEVRSLEEATRTDGSGRYRLRVARGLRELTYVAPGRTPVRKLVVVRERRDAKRDVTLDVLMPAPGAAARKRLVVQRGYATDSTAKDLPLEVGDSTLVSTIDELGNDDEAVSLGHPERVYAPVWAPGSEDAIFYNVTTPGKTAETRFDLMGVHRYNVSSRTDARLWGGMGRATQLVAVSPSGDAFVASTPQNAFLVEGLTGGRESVIYGTTTAGARTGTVLGAFWAPDASIYLAVSDPIGDAASESRIARLPAPGQAAETGNDRLVASTTEFFKHPVALSDGRLLFSYATLADATRHGIRLRETDGTVRDLLPGGWQPVSLVGDILLYIQDDDLHRRNLTTGQDLVIAQATEWAAWR